MGVDILQPQQELRNVVARLQTDLNRTDVGLRQSQLRIQHRAYRRVASRRFRGSRTRHDRRESQIPTKTGRWLLRAARIIARAADLRLEFCAETPAFPASSAFSFRH